MLLNQSVLLRGVNDDPETMATLLRELVYTLGAKPYYLHHCDLTRGVSHFRTTIDRGLSIVAALRGSVSGLCQPHYMLDLPGGHGKVPLAPPTVVARDDRRWTLRAWDGAEHDYEECTRLAAVPSEPMSGQRAVTPERFAELQAELGRAATAASDVVRHGLAAARAGWRALRR